MSPIEREMERVNALLESGIKRPDIFGVRVMNELRGAIGWTLTKDGQSASYHLAAKVEPGGVFWCGRYGPLGVMAPLTERVEAAHSQSSRQDWRPVAEHIEMAIPWLRDFVYAPMAPECPPPDPWLAQIECYTANSHKQD